MFSGFSTRATTVISVSSTPLKKLGSPESNVARMGCGAVTARSTTAQPLPTATHNDLSETRTIPPIYFPRGNTALAISVPDVNDAESAARPAARAAAEGVPPRFGTELKERRFGLLVDPDLDDRVDSDVEAIVG